MKYTFETVLAALCCLLLSVPALAAGPAQTVDCSNVTNMRSVSPSGRGGTLIWKSNWNRAANREQTYREGNHSQKGAAFLVYYRSVLAPRSRVLEVRDLNCNLIAKMGRYPRCTAGFGCGQHERWYLKGPGGSFVSIPALAKKTRAAGATSVLIQLKNGTFAKVQNIYHNREIAP